MKKNICLFTCFVFLLLCCKKKENEITKEDPVYDREAMLRSISERVFQPQAIDFATAASNLKTKSTSFTQIPDTATLHRLQEAWKNTSKSWSAIEAYKVGYIMTAGLHTQLNQWPTNISLIESEITGSSILTEEYIQMTGTSRKGLPAIEYLIFDADTTVLKRFTTDASATRRKAYLEALCAHVSTHANLLEEYWNSESNRSVFYSNAGISVGGNTSVLFNSMISICEVMTNSKVGVPLGKKSSGVVQPQQVQSRTARYNREQLAMNLKSLKALIRGSVEEEDANGFDDYMDFVNAQAGDEKLSVNVLNQITLCEQDLNNLQDDISTGLTTENAEIEQLYLDLKALLILLKVDVSSQLSITVTFSDNDGD